MKAIEISKEDQQLQAQNQFTLMVVLRILGKKFKFTREQLKDFLECWNKDMMKLKRSDQKNFMNDLSEYINSLDLNGDTTKK
jgi:hypothetical protein